MRALTAEDLHPLGSELSRPECVVAARDGGVYVPDWRGGVTWIRPDGRQETLLARDPPVELKPNGICEAPQGGFYIANLADAGGLWWLREDGGLEPVALEADGVALPPANFIFSDTHGRIWASFSTRKLPRQQAWRTDVRDGFVVRVENGVANVVLDELHYTNEVRVTPDGDALVIVETFGQRLTRCPIARDGRLGAPTTLAGFGAGFFPDGFAFDVEGGIWVTSLISNRLIRLADDGSMRDMFAAAAFDRGDEVQGVFERGELRAEHLGPAFGAPYGHLTSIAFGGPDGRTAWLGCLHGGNIWTFRSEIAGVR